MSTDAKDLPEPMVPAEVDLRDFATMPMAVQKVRDSRFVSEVKPEAFRAGFLLWCASWHQVPAGSVPDNDIELAKLAGYGFAVSAWKKLRKEALTNFVLCSDGRLYHREVSARALVAWQSRLEHFYIRAKERLRKASKDTKPISFEHWNARRLATGMPMEKVDASPDEDADSAGSGPPIPPPAAADTDGIPPENATKGKGTEKEQNGEGELLEKNTPPVSPQAHARGQPAPGRAIDPEAVVGDHRPTRAGELCRLMKAEGIPNTNPGHPDLLALIAADVSDDEVRGVCAAALGKGNPFAYALAALTGQRQRAAAVVLHAGPLPATETPYQRAQRERMQAAVPSIAAKAPGTVNPNPMEVLDARIRTPR